MLLALKMSVIPGLRVIEKYAKESILGRQNLIYSTGT